MCEFRTDPNRAPRVHFEFGTCAPGVHVTQRKRDPLWKPRGEVLGTKNRTRANHTRSNVRYRSAAPGSIGCVSHEAPQAS